MHMITFILLIKSLLIGFVVAMPVGPIGVLCIDHSVRGGMRLGVSAGIGAALADGIFGFIGGLGSVAFVSGESDPWEFKCVGAVLILLLGLKNVFHNRPAKKRLHIKSEILKVFFTTFFLTLTNPLTVLSFAAIFAGVGIVMDEIPKITALYLGIGIFFGSLLWWLSLAFFSSLISKRMNVQNIQVITRISGVLLIIFSGFIFYQVFNTLFTS
jgi:threonine/homoserine/homoserine lactone efflux protein